MNKLAITAALAAIAVPSAYLSAQNAEAPGAMDASRVTAGTYAADPAHTLVEWRLDHFGFNPYFGLFGDIEGTLDLDPANLAAAKVDVQIPIAAVAVASEGLKDHLLRPGKDGGDPDFFGPEPGMARFVSTGVTPLGGTRAIINGTLTMNGKSGPVALIAQFSGAGTNPMNQAETVGFTAETTIQRSAWGIAYGIPMIGDEVDLKISAAFEKQ